MAAFAHRSSGFHFGVYTLNVSAGELLKHGTRIKLQELPFQLLTTLVERQGEVVTREELRQRLWPDSTFVDFDHNISSAINKLRNALNDSATHPHYVETVGRRGYRFIYPVTTGTPTTASMLRFPKLAPAYRRIALLAIPVLAGLAITIAYTLRESARSGGSKTIRSIAVLPLQNLSSEREQEYFSEGLTDELITRLASLEGLRVISRTSAMQYRNSHKPLPFIARELNVDAVVEGSVLHSGGRVRISARLVDATDSEIWAKSYERDHRDILDLQNEVTRDIAENIRLKINPADQQRLAVSHPVDPEAYEAYLQGRFYLAKRRPADVRTAALHFERAISRDSKYARAYAGLADSYILLTTYSLAPPQEIIAKARQTALKALEMEEGLAEAHTSLAVAAAYGWDWQGAEKEYRRAIQSDPNYGTAHHWYAELLAYHGRFDEAFAEIERARQLDPLSLIIASDRAEILYLSRGYERAIEQCRKVLEVDPNFPQAHYLLVFSYAQQGRFAEALADIGTWRNSDETPWSLMLGAYINGRSGQQEKARQALQKLEQLNRRRPIDPGSILIAHVGMGNKEAAFSWFEKAYTARSAALSSLKVNPIYDPLRDDPRFRDLLRRAGLAQ